MPASEPTILVIDDDTDLQRLLSLRFSTAGYKVVTTTTAQEALDVMRGELPHLVISDLRLPDMDGLALLELDNQVFCS